VDGSWAVRCAAIVLAVGVAAPTSLLAQTASRNPGRIPDDVFDKMIPKHPGKLSALAPANIAKPRPKPPIDITGTWFVDLRDGFSKFMFGPPYPQFMPQAQKDYEEGQKAAAEKRTYRDAIGQCYPPGMPMIMTRVWPHAFIQIPTAIYMVSGFENSFRTIYLDGRDFSNPDTVVYTYNGESIGHFEGKTLVVHTKYIEPDNHYIDSGLPISEQFEITERIDLIEGGKIMQVEYIMTDPVNWKGEWRNTKRFLRADETDINEVECILANNEHLPGTELGNSKAEPRE
jgi:hypothetical protein